MKSIETTMGWLVRLTESGCKATYRNGLFGRIHWLVKNGKDTVDIVQGISSAVKTEILNPARGQFEIVKKLIKIGVCKIISNT